MTGDDAGLVEKLVPALEANGVRDCLIGDRAVDAYADPVVSLDLDVVAAAEQLSAVESLLRREFTVRREAHGLNASLPGSDVRVQVQTDPRYPGFVGRAAVRQVLGRELPVASVEDVLRGKVWAVTEPSRRASKRQKDLADIARLLEARPELRARVPAAVLDRLL